MPPSTPSSTQHTVPGMPHLSPVNSRHRSSIGSSFSFGPQHLVDSYLDANSSTASNPNSLADPNRSVLPASPLRSSPRRHRKAKESLSRQPHPLANDTTDVFQESDDDRDEESEYEWGMVDRMRLWRHDALMQHLYETAAFWGDKILSWTNDPNDAFWLAQTYFMTHQYSRAERLLTRPFPTSPPKRPATPPATNGHPFLSGKGKAREQDPPPPLTSMPRLPVGPGGMIEVPEEMQERVSRLVDMSVACRYLAAQCQVRQGNWAEATEMLGEANPFRDSGRSGPAVPNIDGGIKVEASMCHLRGVLMLKLNRGDQAKQCFMEALALDVKCYDAFEQLVTGEMMTPDEEWEFVQGLAYAQQTPQDAEFVRLIYTCRLRKYKHAEEHALTRQRLVDEYGLGDNPDVLYSFADALYANFRWADCFVITSRILGLVSIHNATMPLHIACMYHLSHLHSKLFILAHEMVDREPENPISWYAVGVWYLSGGKWAQARQYFSKTSLMDPRFGPAWIAFAHTFAFEGEHDHAVTAYSTCARMFTGSHLPLMFVGMENIMLSNYALADEALNAANSMCDGDPLLVNEMGVMAFNHGDFQRAADLFSKALEVAQVTQSSQNAWATTYLNLGTSLRKLGHLKEAKEAYQKVLELDSRHSMALGFLGLVHHLMGEIDKAIVKYHEALSIDPINPHILELLNMALEQNIMGGPSPIDPNEMNKTMKILKEKYARLHDSKVKDKAPRDVRSDVGDAGDEMNLGSDWSSLCYGLLFFVVPSILPLHTFAHLRGLHTIIKTNLFCCPVEVDLRLTYFEALLTPQRFSS
ncbi:putative anaphase-promoting complex, cyclosome, subunit 3 [Lyophyllum shimeji]|uniref:Anaphase-promoting complex, cyclosome, subunit 3 n=1 Tax=Lyophyllum shimeji TaxID=47721 RepID=A0A9P3UPS0_LYOSH|nr:putative anaphase-promoting complex, cyclosome, subunit 3 [Lyophyllum shimeji]